MATSQQVAKDKLQHMKIKLTYKPQQNFYVLQIHYANKRTFYAYMCNISNIHAITNDKQTQACIVLCNIIFNAIEYSKHKSITEYTRVYACNDKIAQEIYKQCKRTYNKLKKHLKVSTDTLQAMYKIIIKYPEYRPEVIE